MEERRQAHLDAFKAFDLDGSGQISAVDINTALGMCDDLGEIEVTNDDTKWAMRRHGVRQGEMMTFMQFSGVAEAIWKRRIEPKEIERRRVEQMKAERDREEVEWATRRRQVKRVGHEQADPVSRAFLAFDEDNSGEVSGVDLLRMLQMTGLKGVKVATLQTALDKLGKTRGELFNLLEFRTIHSIAIAESSKQKQTRVVPPMETVQPPTPPDALIFLSTQQNLPAGLPPPMDSSQILSNTPQLVKSSPPALPETLDVRSLPLPSSNAGPGFSAPVEPEVHQAPDRAAPAPEPHQESLLRQLNEYQHSFPVPMAPPQSFFHEVQPVDSVGQPLNQPVSSSIVCSTAQPMPSPTVHLAPVPEAVSVPPSQHPSYPEPSQDPPKSKPTEPSLREVRVIGDELRLRASIEAHQHIKGWNQDYAVHVGARGIVLRDMPNKNAIGVRFNDGKVAWYPANCVIEYDPSQPEPAPPAPVPRPERSVGPMDLSISNLFRNALNPPSTSSWVSESDAPPMPQQPHHLQHSSVHCHVVGVDEVGDDVPGGERSPEKVNLHSDYAMPSHVGTETSLPGGAVGGNRYCPPPRGNYKPPTMPKYDITELDAIYPLGKKKVEVKDKELELVFGLFDVEKTGEVRRSEFRTMIRSLGYTVPRAEVVALFTSHGKGEKGTMMLGEFQMYAKEIGKKHKRNKKVSDITAMKASREKEFPLPSPTDELRTLFFMFDDSAEGQLSRNQLTICLNSLGLDDTHEVDVFLDVDRIFGNPNIPRDETTIGLEAFIRLVKQLQANQFAENTLG